MKKLLALVLGLNLLISSSGLGEKDYPIDEWVAKGYIVVDGKPGESKIGTVAVELGNQYTYLRDGKSVSDVSWGTWLEFHGHSESYDVPALRPYYQEIAVKPRAREKDRPAAVVWKGGNYSLYSQFQNPNGYSLHGRPSDTSTATNDYSKNWEGMRFILSNQQQMPGLRGDARGRAESVKISHILREWSDYISNLEKQTEGLKAAQLDLLKEVLRPAVDLSEKGHLGLAKIYEDTIPAILDKTPAVDAKVKSVLPDFTPATLGSAVVTDIGRQIEQTTPKDRWKQWDLLEAIESIAADGYENIPPLDQIAFREIYGKYFDNQGLVNDRVVDAKNAIVAKQIGYRLQTSFNSPEGQQVRGLINRGLIASETAKNESLKQTAYGGVALAVGADQAYAEGRAEEGRFLSQGAAEAIDFALGFIPVLGALNDAASIIHGLATGYDLTGKRMEWTDYALRGAGIVLGGFGLGLIKSPLLIGKAAVNKTFAMGSQAIRKMGPATGDAIRKIVARSRASDWILKEVPEAVGRALMEDSKFSSELFLSDRFLGRFEKASEAVANARKEELLFGAGKAETAAANLAGHLKDHVRGVQEAIGKVPDAKLFVETANRVVREGSFHPEANAFVLKVLTASDTIKAFFVGINAKAEITTFHVKNLKKLYKKAPSSRHIIIP